ncbi:MAG: hypothetical protein RR332_02965 [Clostridiales bacterium]
MKKRMWCFAIGAVMYPLLEMAFRGHSHWSMSIAGGLALNMIYRIHTKFPRRRLPWQCLSGAFAITAVEFVTGCIVNKWLKLSVWDYSHLPCQFMGQICLPFFCIWLVLCLPVFTVIKRVELHRSSPGMR